MFNIDNESGAINVAGDLVANRTSTIDCGGFGSTPPTPLVPPPRHHSVELPAERGISYAVYTNINGTLVSALTNHSVSPRPGRKTNRELRSREQSGDNWSRDARLFSPARRQLHLFVTARTTELR
jgi:hypothetical protein